MSFFCYMFAFVDIFWVVSTNICDYVIQQVLVQVKRMTYLVWGYIVYCQYISLEQELKLLYKKKQIPSERLCRAMRIMFEVNTEEIRRKGCIMLSCIIYSACHILELWKNIGKWVRNVACMGLKVIFNRFLFGRCEGKGPFRRPVWICEDNVEMDFKELYEDGFRIFMLWESD